MNLEGTKHEKALLVILAYIVGMTSGFIAFGLTQDNYQATEAQPIFQTEELTEMTSSEDTANEPAIPDKIDTVTAVDYVDGRLQLHFAGETSLLSVEKSQLTAEVITTFSNQGAHVAVPAYTLSPDKKFLYFCEQHSNVDSCNNFVYDIYNKNIHYITTNNTKITTTNEQAKSAVWTSEGKLTILDQLSIDTNIPWKLVKLN